jgi:signal transduction histidine kinase
VSSSARDLIVLGRDGTVVYATATDAARWIGRVLAEEEGVPVALRDAAASRTDTELESTRLVFVDAVPLRRAVTDVPALLAGTIERLKAQADSIDVSLAVEADAGVPSARIDPEKVAWAVATLVGNSLRYVRRGTRRMPGGAIRVRVGTDGACVVITVADDGPGIPEEKLPSLFRRQPGVVHGTGLALVLVRDVAVAHGGDVEVASSTDRFACGTTIVLRLPLA